jgi:hypothetical protein
MPSDRPWVIGATVAANLALVARLIVVLRDCRCGQCYRSFALFDKGSCWRCWRVDRAHLKRMKR